MRFKAAIAFVLTLVGCLATQSLAQSREAQSEDRAFTFEKVRDGIYHAVGTGALAVGSNGAVVVNEEDVLIVDSHMTPAAARALEKELGEITDKPIRYVVNTHFHFDHAHGNQVFDTASVEIIAHSFTYQALADGSSQRGRAYESFVLSAPARIEALETKLSDPTELESLEEGEQEDLQRSLAGLRAFWDATRAVEVVAPTLTLERKLTLHRGGREIQLLFLGRGHTGGDVIVYLPAEKVLVTGDLLTENLPYMGDAFVPEWIDTLETMKALDIEVILPGHGNAFEDVDKISQLQAYLEDLWAQVSAAHAAGHEIEHVVESVDLSAHAKHFSRAASPVSSHAIARIFELLDSP